MGNFPRRRFRLFVAHGVSSKGFTKCATSREGGFACLWLMAFPARDLQNAQLANEGSFTRLWLMAFPAGLSTCLRSKWGLFTAHDLPDSDITKSAK
jgi:hypothetical protein